MTGEQAGLVCCGAVIGVILGASFFRYTSNRAIRALFCELMARGWTEEQIGDLGTAATKRVRNMIG